MIEAHGLTKHYGPKTAVDDLTFTVKPGVVTGFLGPNGAGQVDDDADDPRPGRPDRRARSASTARPTASTRRRCSEVGALLEARSVHTGRSACNHLLALAQTAGIPKRRVDEVIELVGLGEVARKRAGGFSLGMGQRLGHRVGAARRPAHADPRRAGQRAGPGRHPVDPQPAQVAGRRGAHVFVSSHLMSEMALTADHLIVVGRGRLIADTSVADFIAASSGNRVRVRTTDVSRLAQVLGSPDVALEPTGGDGLRVAGLTTDQIGMAAAGAGVTLLELTAEQTSLEEAFMDLTKDSVEYHGSATAAPSPTASPLETTGADR